MEAIEKEPRYDISGMTFTTLCGLLDESVARGPNNPLWGVKKDGHYQWMTYAEFGTLVRKFRTILKRAGLGRGDRIAVIANNSVEFAMAVYAAYGLGAILVPMYEVQKIQDWEYILGDSKPKIAVVGNEDIREKIEGLGCDSLKEIYVVRDLHSEGRPLMTLVRAETEETASSEELSGDDVSDLIYTSGTTGRPRGVVLTHAGVTENVKATCSRFPISERDRTLAFLPWAHAFGKTVELHLFVAIGASIGLVESNRTIAINLKEVNPTVLISVPKIFNKIYDTIHIKMEEKRIVRALFEHTESLASRAREGKISAFGKLQYSILDKIIAKKVRAAFGNSLRFCISGGASLSKEVAIFFANFGIRVYEGYGMTEHSPIVAVNNPEVNHIGSVGRALPGVTIEILHDNDNLDKSDEKCGEIVVSSPSVMKSYFNSPEATAETIDAQNRLHTGDMGYLDEAGCLWITGRVKEQYKLENGKYVVPTALEEKINISTIIANAVVFGSGRPYNVVLIIPTPEFLQKFREENKIGNVPNEELAKNAALRAVFEKELQKQCADFRGYERPQKFALVLDEFTIQNGMLSPALKVKRREVEKKYADLLQSLYRG